MCRSTLAIAIKGRGQFVPIANTAQTSLEKQLSNIRTYSLNIRTLCTISRHRHRRKYMTVSGSSKRKGSARDHHI